MLEIRKELLHWRFLDSWKGCLPWKSKCHIQLCMYSDASHCRWVGCLVIPGQSPSEACGLWDVESCALPIAVKESFALLRTLESLASRVHNARIDAFVDNKVLLASWENQLSRSQAISDVLKSLFELSYACILHLSLVYIPSKENPADSPSRVVSDLDCTHSPIAWQRVNSAFSPHTLDLMAIPCNIKCDRSGHPLRFFSPYPCPKAAGTNVFAHWMRTLLFSCLLCLSVRWSSSCHPKATLFPFSCLTSARTSSGGHWLKDPLHLLSSLAQREILAFCFSPPDPVLQCGVLTTCSGIFGSSGSPVHKCRHRFH